MVYKRIEFIHELLKNRFFNRKSFTVCGEGASYHQVIYYF